MTTVLLVAPDVGLAGTSHEVQAIVNTSLEVHLLQGRVDQRAVIEASGLKQWDVLWLAMHGDRDGVQLSDGSLSSSALTSLVRSGNIGVVFLNTCESVSVASAVQQETGADVICTVMAAPDVDAYRTGALFARHLAETGDARRAYELSKPGQNRLYLYLAGNRERWERDHASRVLDELRQIERRLTYVEERLRPDRPHPHRREALALAVVLMLVDHLLLVSDIRHALGVNGPSAVVVGLSAFLLAMFLVFVTQPE